MAALSATLIVVGCGDTPSGGSQATPPVGSLAVLPVIESFSANPPQIREGQQTELSWSVSAAATVRIAPLRGTVQGGHMAVSPVVTTTYTLTATNAIGSTMQSLTVSVNEESGPSDGSTAVSSADPTGTSPGGATTDVPVVSVAPADEYASVWVDSASNLVGLPSECGNMSIVSAKPDADILVAGVAQQGLWSSVNGSASWERLGQGPGSAQIVNRTGSIVYDPVDPNVFWQSGNYNSLGVYRTNDNGVTFTGLGDIGGSDYLSVDFSDPARQTLLSGVHERAILYRSLDGGATWTDIATTLPENIGFASSPLVINSTTYLVGTKTGSSSGIFRTTDSGQTWTEVFGKGVFGAPLVTASDGAIYWLIEGGQGMVSSTDQGLTWTEATGVGPRSGFSSTILQMPDGRIVAVGASYLVATADKGKTWFRLGPAFPYEPTGFTYSAFRNTFYAWRFDCDFSTDNPIQSDSMVRLEPAAP